MDACHATAARVSYQDFAVPVLYFHPHDAVRQQASTSRPFQGHAKATAFQNEFNGIGYAP